MPILIPFAAGPTRVRLQALRTRRLHRFPPDLYCDCCDYRFPASDLMAKARFLGVTAIRWLEYLLAILTGNAIYYLSLAPHLPDVFRHQGFQMDGGVLV